jgi:hypothetical protein
VKVRTGVCSAPATGFNKLRTAEMNRASARALAGPYQANNSSSRRMPSAILGRRTGSCWRTPPDHQLFR